MHSNKGLDFYSDLDPAPPSDVYDSENDGKLTFTRLVYDQAAIVSQIKPKDTDSEPASEGFLASIGEIFSAYPLAMTFLILILILALCGTGYLMKETYAPIELNYDHVDEDNEIVEAEIMD